MSAYESAFPVPERLSDYDSSLLQAAQEGLTKRELFAAMAMQGMMADRAVHGNDNEQIAQLAVDAADRLLHELAYIPGK